MQRGPSLSLNMAMTLDGHVVRPDGRWYGLTSGGDRARMDEIRLRHDALLVGLRTLQQDDPVLWVRDGGGEAREDSPIPVLICRNSLPSLHLKLFRSPRTPLLFLEESLASREAQRVRELEEVSEIRLLDRSEAGVRRVLELLGERGLGRLLLEGGPTFNYPFFEEDLVDRFYLTLVPFLVGQGDLPSPVQGRVALPDFDSRRWILEEHRSEGSELYLTYRRDR